MPVQAHAQIYECIKFCKFRTAVTIACIVGEKGADKIYEMGIEYLVREA